MIFTDILQAEGNVFDIDEVPEEDKVFTDSGDFAGYARGRLVCFRITNTPAYGRVTYSASYARLAGESRTAAYVWILVTWVRLPVSEQITRS